MTSEGRAAGLVSVRPYGQAWRVYFGTVGVHVYGVRAEAERVADAYRAEALREGLRGGPVSEGRLAEVRRWSEWMGGGEKGPRPPMPAEGQLLWSVVVRDLLAVIDHQAAQVAARDALLADACLDSRLMARVVALRKALEYIARLELRPIPLDPGAAPTFALTEARRAALAILAADAEG